MKILLNIPLVCLVLAASVVSSPAMMEITNVSKERAEEMGIEVRSKAVGSGNVRVEIEFKRQGKLKRFDPDKYSRIELRVMDGEKSMMEGGKALINAALQMRKTDSESVRVEFLAARDRIPHVCVMIIVGAGVLPGGGFELDLNDFVDLEKLTKQ